MANPAEDNSGVFLRFRDPWISPTPDLGVQIDDPARGDNNTHESDGLDKNRTGAIYKIPSGQAGGPLLQQFDPPDPLRAGEWNHMEIEVIENTYKLLAERERTTRFVNRDPSRGLPHKVDPRFGFIGLQSYAGPRASFRNVRIKVL